MTEADSESSKPVDDDAGGGDPTAGDDAEDGGPSANTAPIASATAGLDASPPAPICTPCTSDRACRRTGIGCVASVGGGYCAPACTKEGFCTPDRVCERVTNPAGQSWTACLPRRGRCDALESPAILSHIVHASRL
jgi:hypothetical protein